MVASTLWQSKTAAPMLPGGPLQPGPFRCGTKLGEAARFQQACRDLDTLRKNYRQSLESQISQLERELKGVRNQREKRTVSAARARKNRIRKSLSHLPAGLNLTLGGEAMSQQGGGASSHFVDRRGSVPAMMTDSPGDETSSASDSDGVASPRSGLVAPARVVDGVQSRGDSDVNGLCSALEGLSSRSVLDEEVQVENEEAMSPKRRGTV
ncbi:hypothetical protein B0H67DRAFT_553056 [Lasiosphaeris hirsuta]|uniref:Uncharacterized protein n=1 Tax=Lasiosphaeris hirsuta TaxID=260670 RepID=A0AA40AS79_9PEZI|nr:hypothetical protein B0H67DRAFT_553056 [Lasiosphaeris hirsuta]